VVRRMLLECGAQVVAAGSAADALAALSGEGGSGVGVLVSDIGMAEVDGYELMRRVRAGEAAAGGGARLPAVALTAFARAEDREHALAAGFDEHVAKPVRARELVAAVARVAGK